MVSPTEAQDVIVSVGGPAPGGPASDPARPVVELARHDALPDFLAGCRAASITVRAPWSQLDSAVLSSLAEWAAGDPERACGVLPIDVPGPSPTEPDQTPSAFVVDDSGAWTLTPRGPEPLELQVCLDRLGSATPPTGVAITGHGGEHCITIGDRWLATHSEVGLPGPLVFPDAVRTRAVFLNTCGSLRMGDSIVPRELSLASALNLRGAAVIGAFRNQFAFAEAPHLFAHHLMAGAPMGRIVNALNRESVRRGNPFPSYQLLGDALFAPLGPRPGVDVPPPRAPHSVALPLGDLIWLDQLSRTITTWVDPDRVVVVPAFEYVLRLALRAAGAAAHGTVSATDVQLVQEAARAAAIEQRQRILEVLSQYSLQSKWPQELYAAFSAPPGFSPCPCPRCGGRLVLHGFSPRRAGLLSVSSHECDGCGTVRDAVGEPPAMEPFQARVEGEELHVRLPPLPDDCRGRVTVYRSRSIAPSPWPVEGGVVRVPLAAIPFRGKTTICASWIGPDFLALDYATLFTGVGA